jgi:NAD(P)-dependent dehydrogenase (short-subunit alcohol dehydrogenase family)
VIRFDGRAAVVTGAGRGLGAAYAHSLAGRGASVVVHDAGVDRRGEGGDPSVADAVVEEIQAAGGTAVACYENLESDEGCARVIETCVEAFGRLDVLVNNAGLVVYAELDEAAESWERLRRVNVDAPFHLSRAAFVVMKGRRYGRLVFTTSGIAMSVDDTRPGLTAYAAGKMAQFGLMVVFAPRASGSGSVRTRSRPWRPRASTRGRRSRESSSRNRWPPASSSSLPSSAPSTASSSAPRAESSGRGVGREATVSTSAGSRPPPRRSPSGGARSTAGQAPEAA